jgi:hypothetical protein
VSVDPLLASRAGAALSRMAARLSEERLAALERHPVATLRRRVALHTSDPDRRRRMLSDSDATVRHAAVQAHATNGAPLDFDALRGVLTDPTTAMATARALSTYSGPTAAPNWVVQAALAAVGREAPGSVDIGVARWLALRNETLLEVADPASLPVPVVRALLREGLASPEMAQLALVSPDFDTRRAIASFLETAPTASVLALRHLDLTNAVSAWPAIQTEHFEVRARALRNLAFRLDDDVAAQRLLEVPSEPAHRICLASVLRDLPASIDASTTIRALLADTNPRVRRAGLAALLGRGLSSPSDANVFNASLDARGTWDEESKELAVLLLVSVSSPRIAQECATTLDVAPESLREALLGCAAADFPVPISATSTIWRARSASIRLLAAFHAPLSVVTRVAADEADPASAALRLIATARRLASRNLPADATLASQLNEVLARTEVLPSSTVSALSKGPHSPAAVLEIIRAALPAGVEARRYWQRILDGADPNRIDVAADLRPGTQPTAAGDPQPEWPGWLGVTLGTTPRRAARTHGFGLLAHYPQETPAQNK